MFDPAHPFYQVSFPNADTIVSILPFLLIGLLLITAYFATYLLYQQVLFVPDSASITTFQILPLFLIGFTMIVSLVSFILYNLSSRLMIISTTYLLVICVIATIGYLSYTA